MKDYYLFKDIDQRFVDCHKMLSSLKFKKINKIYDLKKVLAFSVEVHDYEDSLVLFFSIDEKINSSRTYFKITIYEDKKFKQPIRKNQAAIFFKDFKLNSTIKIYSKSIYKKGESLW